MFPNSQARFDGLLEKIPKFKESFIIISSQRSRKT